MIWCRHKQAHAGHKRVAAELAAHWYWPSTGGTVRRTLSMCEICLMLKHGPTNPTTGQRRLLAGKPWQVVAVDLIGSMLTSGRGNKWILVISDHFTHWADARLIPTMQGSQFESKLLAELCSLWKCEKSHTTPYHPQQWYRRAKQPYSGRFASSLATGWSSMRLGPSATTSHEDIQELTTL